MAAGILGLWWFWRGGVGGSCTATSVTPPPADVIPPKLLSRPPAATGAVPPEDEEEEEEAALLSSQHSPLALLSPLQQSCPPPFQDSFRGAQPCTLFLSGTSRKSITSNVSRQRGSFSPADAHQRLFLRGNGIWSRLYRSCTEL